MTKWALVLPILYLALIGLVDLMAPAQYLNAWIPPLENEALRNAFVLLLGTQVALSAFSSFPFSFVLMGAMHLIGTIYVLDQAGENLADLDIPLVAISAVVPFAAIQVVVVAGRRLLKGPDTAKF